MDLHRNSLLGRWHGFIYLITLDLCRALDTRSVTLVLTLAQVCITEGEALSWALLGSQSRLWVFACFIYLFKTQSLSVWPRLALNLLCWPSTSGPPASQDLTVYHLPDLLSFICPPSFWFSSLCQNYRNESESRTAQDSVFSEDVHSFRCFRAVFTKQKHNISI